MTDKGDLISREDLRKAVNDFYDNHFKGLVPKELITYAEAVDNFIDNAPTVSFMISPDYVTELQNRNNELIKQLEEVERSQGEWKHIIDEYNDVECPFCGFQEDGVYYNYCPGCGAKMGVNNND